MRYYQDPVTERWFKHPISEEDAREVGDYLYTDIGVKCPHCSLEDTVRYVGFPTSCFRCVVYTYNNCRATNLDNFVVDIKPCKKGPHLKKILKSSVGKKCVICEELASNVSHRELPPPRSPSKNQIACGEDRAWYMPDSFCPDCGTTAPKEVWGTRCQGCESIRTVTLSPRQAALAAGDAWYTPDTPCRKCRTTASRRVTDGRCLGCHPVLPPTPREPVPSPRKDALAAGDTWYTPDTPCHRCGTLEDRYVANGRCKGCIEGVAAADAAGDSDMPYETASMLGFNVFTDKHSTWCHIITGIAVHKS